MGNELHQLMKDVAALLREREEARAFERLRDATRQASLKRHAAAAEAVTAVNGALFAARRERERFLAEIQRLPPMERAGVEARLMTCVDQLFNDEIARLTSLKRELSNPRSSIHRTKD